MPDALLRHAARSSAKILAVGVKAIEVAVPPNEHDGLAIGRELRHEAVGVVGGQKQRLAVGKIGQQQTIAFRGA